MGDQGTARPRLRIDTAGASADEAELTLSSLYNGIDWRIDRTNGEYAYRYAAIGDAAMTLRSSRMRGRITGDIPPGDDYIVQWLTSGTATVDVGREPIVQTADLPTLFPTQRSFVFEYADYDQRILHLGRTGVDAIIEERTGIRAGTARFVHGSALPAAVPLWHDVIRLVSRTVQRGDVQPVLWAELSRMATVAFLELYPPQGTALPAVLDRPEHARLRLVVEYVHEFAHLPLTTTELAAVADMSVRGLHDGFRRVLDTTAMEYVRGVRLDRVRAALDAGRPGDTTVAAEARRWGFAHAGRFAATYARRFGEHPGATLAR